MADSVTLRSGVTDVPGIGPTVARGLDEAFGIVSVGDLVWHAPSRVADAGMRTRAADVQEGAQVTLVGRIGSWSVRRVRGGRVLAEATLHEADGSRFRASFFNQKWRPRATPEGSVVSLSGKAKRYRGTVSLTNPQVTQLGDLADLTPSADALSDPDRSSTDRFSTVYPATEALPSHVVRRAIHAALDALEPVPEHLPDAVLAEHGLVGFDTALRQLHRPAEPTEGEAAHDRLVVDELFVLQCALLRRRARHEAATRGKPCPPADDGRARAFLDSLPFTPTGAQQRAFAELGDDLRAERPMHRLLQGDVGAGKTLVAAWSMLCAVDNGRQAALMVPTEVLADQHHRTLTNLLAPLGLNVLDGLRLALLTGSTPVSERRRVLSQLLTGELDLVVGTHALLEEGVRFRDLGVVVVDEQHRFGVAQRVTLTEKGADAALDGPPVDERPVDERPVDERPADERPVDERRVAETPVGGKPRAGDGRAATPHVLVMTATPIPRSLALTSYGDLDVTELDELPPGRKPITTALIPPPQAQWRRERVEDFVRREVADGGQVYWVCSLVEDSEQVDARAAVTEHRRLSEQVFADLRVGLVHGQLPTDAKDDVMTAFNRGEVDVLVATTVIEVGVDNPEAAVMVIEDAHRFGLSQLHQLRGRVGRGARRSFCILFGDPESSADAKARLDAMVEHSNGFLLANIDLEVRGQGQLFGAAQSGLRTDLRFASLVHDTDSVAATRSAARGHMAVDPLLEAPSNDRLRAEVDRRYDDDADLGQLSG